MKQPIKIGIVGLGRAGWGMHCEELQGRQDHFQIAAACDLIPSRCERMAERYGCKTYQKIEDLVADPDVELVDIATRSCDHYAHTLLALSAGKIVFLEKPICLTYTEACKIAEAAASRPGSLYIRHNRRFDPDFLHVKEIIASGILGDIYEIRLARHNFQRRDDWQTIRSFGGGQLLNWGPHIIDHALRFLESPVESMFSDLKQIAAAGDSEDHVKIILKGKNGRLVDLEISGGVAIGSPTYLVFGAKGSLSLTGKEIKLKYLDPARPLQPRTADPETPGSNEVPYHVMIAKRNAGLPADPKIGFGQAETLPWVEKSIPVRPGSNTIIWDALYAAVREGKPFPVRMDESLEVMRVISAAKEGTSFA